MKPQTLPKLAAALLLLLGAAPARASTASDLVALLRARPREDETGRRAYVSLLDALGAEPPQAYAGPDAEVEAELAAIGRDRIARPELYALALRPPTVEAPPTRAPRQPHPSLEETEPCRLVWEYLLLVPPMEGEGGSSLQDALNALERIANDASVPVLVEKFHKDAAYTAGDSGIGVYQGLILGALASFPSPKALDAILDCAAAAERQLQKLDAKIAAMPDPRERANWRIERWSPDAEVARLGEDKRWTKTLRAYQTKNADPLKTRMLAGARRAAWTKG